MATSDTLKSLMAEMSKDKMNNNSFMRSCQVQVYQDIDLVEGVIDTGFYDLDYTLLGNLGGFPRGRIIEIYGKEGAGKSTIAMRAIASAQREGLPCLLADTEFAYHDAHSQKWMSQMGVNINDLLYFPSDIIEQVVSTAHMFFTHGGVLMVIDSIGGALAKAQSIVEKIRDHPNASYADNVQVAAQAKAWTEGIKNLTGIVTKAHGLLICTNQVREKLGAYSPNGQPVYTTPGGQLLKHNFSIRLQVDRVKAIEESGMQVGILSRVKVTKNKVSGTEGWKSGQQTPSHLAIYYDGRQVDAWASILQTAINAGIIEQRGPTYTYHTGIKAVGKERIKEALKEAGITPDDLKQEALEATKNHPVESGGGDYTTAEDALDDTVDYVVAGEE